MNDEQLVNEVTAAILAGSGISPSLVMQPPGTLAPHVVNVDELVERSKRTLLETLAHNAQTDSQNPERKVNRYTQLLRTDITKRYYKVAYKTIQQMWFSSDSRLKELRVEGLSHILGKVPRQHIAEVEDAIKDSLRKDPRTWNWWFAVFTEDTDGQRKAYRYTGDFERIVVSEKDKLLELNIKSVIGDLTDNGEFVSGYAWVSTPSEQINLAEQSDYLFDQFNIEAMYDADAHHRAATLVKLSRMMEK